jgi:outer membrane protein OmpA-like peptidoglycan-associated protein
MKKRSIIVLLSAVLALPVLAGVADESRHYLTTELGIGYSALLKQTEAGKSSGLAGGKLQVGYEWNYRRFLLHTGVEFASVNDLSKMDPFQKQTDYTIGLPSGQYMTQYYDFRSFKETQYLGQVNIPVQVGGLFADRYYFLAGVRLGLPVLHGASEKADVRTWLTDPSLIGELGGREEVVPHDAYQSIEKGSTRWGANVLNAQVSAEVGLLLNSFWDTPSKGRGRGSRKNQKAPVLYRVALFADYGVTSVYKPGEAVDIVHVEQPRTVDMHNYMDASQALEGATGKVNSLLVGAKFAVLFQMNKEKPKRKKTEPSFLDVLIKDAATGKAIASQVDIYDVSKGRTTHRDLKNGKLHYRTHTGEFGVTASSEAYYPDSQRVIIAKEGTTERVDFALKARPWLRLRIFNADTKEPMGVSAFFVDAVSGDSVTTIQSDAQTGLARTLLDEGRTYRFMINQTGYEGVEENVAYAGDSMNIGLVPLKVGKKVVLHNMFFATNKTRILPQSEEALDELYAFLRDNPSIKIRITGHTDDVGSEKTNQRLSEGRANAVREEIVRRGIAADRIEAEGKGESEPIADNTTEEGRAKNRRVEITIISTGGEDVEQVKE